MVKTVHKEIEKKIGKYRAGQIIFLSDFRGLGTDAGIRKVLSRLSEEGRIKRIAHGIYLVPEFDPVLGQLTPPIEKIAERIAAKDHVRIKPTGAYALHRLGLTTQVPMKLVYLTDGARRLIKIGKTTIKFKPTTPKKLSLKGELSSLIIYALEELGTERLDSDIQQKIIELLKKEDQKKLSYDLKLAPSRISDFLFRILKSK